MCNTLKSHPLPSQINNLTLSGHFKAVSGHHALIALLQCPPEIAQNGYTDLLQFLAIYQSTAYQFSGMWDMCQYWQHLTKLPHNIKDNIKEKILHISMKKYFDNSVIF